MLENFQQRFHKSLILKLILNAYSCILKDIEDLFVLRDKY